MRTRPITQEELADALATPPEPRRSARTQRPVSSAGVRPGRTWVRPCRRSAAGAGIESASLSRRSAGDVAADCRPVAARSRRWPERHRTGTRRGQHRPANRGTAAPATGSSSNPLRTLDQRRTSHPAAVRIARPHLRRAGRIAARRAAGSRRNTKRRRSPRMRAALHAVLEQLSPASVADQFEQGRARTLAPGQDPRPKYWEHYADFYRLLTQQGAGESCRMRSSNRSARNMRGRARSCARRSRAATDVAVLGPADSDQLAGCRRPIAAMNSSA